MPPIGNTNNQGQDVGPEGRANLQGALGQMNTAGAQLNASKFAQANQNESYRMDALMQVFQLMQQSGIDPNNVQQVRAFLDELEKNNPELYQAFVQAFELLLSGGGQEGAMPILPSGATMPTQIAGAPAGASIAPQGGIARQFPGLAGTE